MYYPGYDYNKPEKAAMEAIRQAQQQYQWQKEIDPSLTIAGVSTTVLSEIYYNKTYSTWMGKNNKIYKQTWGGNGATGGKNNYGKRMSNAWKWAGRGMGAMNAYSIWDDYSNKNTVTENSLLSSYQMSYPLLEENMVLRGALDGRWADK